jgi:ATP-dependent Clp protease ATP-binding subunit ClpC
MLRGLKARYEAHHGMVLADDALAAVVKLSVAWLPDRHLPVPQGARSAGRSLRPRLDRSISKPADKMVGLVVTARTVADVLGEWKGISVDALLVAE